MGGVEEGEQETDGDALGFAALHVRNCALHVGVAERANHFAVWANALGHFETAFARHQGFWMIGFEVVDLGARLAADFKEIFEARSGDERDPSPPSLD